MPEVISRILVQTDHPEHAAFLTEQLSGMKLETVLVQTGEQVLARLNCDEFDLLLLDAERVDIIENIRQEANCDAPIIVLARESEIIQAERCLALGAQDYLREPFNPSLLKVRVTGCLEQRRWKKDLEERERLLRLERDLEIAHRIQTSFLPTELPKVPGWELEACFYPARVVAGDWYDSFYLSNQRRVGFVIADVCDKGLPSALFMALCRSLIRAFAQQNYALRWMDTAQFSSNDWLSQVAGSGEDRQRALPSAGVTALKTAVNLTNNYILENHAESSMFATLFFGVFDPNSGLVSYINAGHNPPLVLDSHGQIKTRLKPTGPAVGIFPGADFNIGHVDLDDGDTLFCFTDGVPDARNPQEQHMGEKRMLELICQRSGLTARGLLDHVDQFVHDHIQDAVQFDDITMLAIRKAGAAVV